MPIQSLLSSSFVCAFAALHLAACSHSAKGLRPAAEASATSAKPALMSPANPQLRVLFIGNSLNGHYDLASTFRNFANTNGFSPYVAEEINNGQDLSVPLRDPNLLRILQTEHWDYVIIQDFSTLALRDPASFRSHVETFKKLIDAAGGKTLLFENWPSMSYGDEATTATQLDFVYTQVGSSVGVQVVYLSKAWDTIYKNVSTELYQDPVNDGLHPSQLGTFLNASMFFKTIYGVSTRGLVHQGLNSGVYLKDGLDDPAPQETFINLDNVYDASQVNYVLSVADQFATPVALNRSPR